MARAWANYKGQYDRFCKTTRRGQGQDLRSQHDALYDEHMEAVEFALGAIHQLGKPTFLDEEGHKDAPDDDYTDGEECYGDVYCICGCNDEGDVNCSSEEEGKA